MGLFSTKPGFQREDLDLALSVTKDVADCWNYDYAEMFGFKLKIAKKSLEESCSVAARLFDEKPFYFARPPGPFKRVAAFLVTGCLHPFFRFDPFLAQPHRRLALPTNTYERRVWHVRFLLLTLPSLFKSIHFRVNGSLSKVEWNGFPSDHFQLEFMNWLKWLDGLGSMRGFLAKEFDWDALQKKRFARMVMATALSLEASSYTNLSNPQGVQGQIEGCMSKLNDEQREDLDFMWLPGN